ncbi:MAG: DUF4357 domain-containing protein [Flavobacteriales bacterium]|nr:DUF4357 domain-containing protein [Flavobacteriales bacterium]
MQDKLVALYCEGKGNKAMGHDAPQGFIVREGSYAAMVFTPSVAEPCISAQRRWIVVANGVLVFDANRYRFTQDYTFSSPSMASTIVLGRPSNGRTDWKDGEGRTLKSLQEAEAGR